MYDAWIAIFGQQNGVKTLFKKNDNFFLALTIENNWGIGPDEHGTCASTSSGTSSALGIYGNIPTNDYSFATIPRARFDPVDGVEQGGSATIAGVLGVDTFNV